MGEVGLAYAPVSYQASGGTAPYTWWVSAGALPGGLSISTDGAISGTPIASGTFNFTVEVNDAGMATANVGGAISVVPRLNLRYVGDMATLNIEDVCLESRADHPCWTDHRYDPFAAVSGGQPPYTYAVVSGTLPPGTRLNGLALTGTYEVVLGEYDFTVAVTDSLGVTATITARYYVGRT